MATWILSIQITGMLIGDSIRLDYDHAGKLHAQQGCPGKPSGFSGSPVDRARYRFVLSGNVSPLAIWLIGLIQLTEKFQENVLCRSEQKQDILHDNVASLYQLSI
jgi:hypothetical protein